MSSLRYKGLAFVLGRVNQDVALTRARRRGQRLALDPGNFIPGSGVLVLAGLRHKGAGCEDFFHDVAPCSCLSRESGLPSA